MPEKLRSDIPQLPRNASSEDILLAGIAAAAGPVSLACSFSVEDIVIIDMLHVLDLPIALFALDTGRLPEETYEVAAAITERYRLDIAWHFPDREAVEALLSREGPLSFRESLEKRHQCCQIRKIEPLGRALTGLAGWITGLRRDQGVTRESISPIEIDTAHGGILKINPLLEWNSDRVWTYADAHRLPVNRLHRQGYPSIGCAPCTRPVAPGEHPRSGRWWWENPEHRECGLHRR